MTEWCPGSVSDNSIHSSLHCAHHHQLGSPSVPGCSGRSLRYWLARPGGQLAKLAWQPSGEDRGWRTGAGGQQGWRTGPGGEGLEDRRAWRTWGPGPMMPGWLLGSSGLPPAASSGAGGDAIWAACVGGTWTIMYPNWNSLGVNI